MPCRLDGLGTGLGPMTDEDCRKMDSQTIDEKNDTILVYINTYKELEEDLCIVRDLLFKYLNGWDVPDNVENIIEDQLKKHKEHRMEDYKYIVENIKDKLETQISVINWRNNHKKKLYEQTGEIEKYNEIMEQYDKVKDILERDKNIINNLKFDDFWKDRYMFENYKEKK